MSNKKFKRVEISGSYIYNKETGYEMYPLTAHLLLIDDYSRDVKRDILDCIIAFLDTDGYLGTTNNILSFKTQEEEIGEII